ncbi:MAG: S24/S26 family peptidase [Opitutaceae bacterium]
MPRAPRFHHALLGALSLGLAFAFAAAARGSVEWNRKLLDAVARNSPAPEVVTARQALGQAADYVRRHPGADFSVGSGDSMLPLYHDRAVIVTERPSLGSLKVGQTVVFMGADGVPMAHILVRRTSRGWVTMGLGNREPDDGFLTDNAYMGVVVEAFQPIGSPILAYATSAHATGEFFAANP